MSAQPSLFGEPPAPPQLDPSYVPALDAERLTRLLDRVRAALATRRWWTLADLARVCQGSEAGVSARIRELRHRYAGGHLIERRRVAAGLFEYRLLR